MANRGNDPLLFRACPDPRRRPETVFFLSGALEALYGLPLMVCRLAKTLVSIETNASMDGAVHVIVMFRIFVIFVGVMAVLITKSIHGELRSLLHGAGHLGLERHWALILLPWRGKTLVLTFGLLLLLHAADAFVMPGAQFGRGLLWGFYCLVALNALVLSALAWVYYWHWGHYVTTQVSELKERAAQVDLDPLSRRLDCASEEPCSICLCCPAEGEVVATLPCGHAFHRACLEPWLLQGNQCPLRCVGELGAPSCSFPRPAPDAAEA